MSFYNKKNKVFFQCRKININKLFIVYTIRKMFFLSIFPCRIKVKIKFIHLNNGMKKN